MRDWYTAAVEANKLTWSPIYVFSALKELGISPVIPVKDADGKLVGVLGIDLTLGDLSNFLRSLEISENGEAFIIEPDGNMVATSTEAPPYKIVDDKQDRLNILENESNLLRITTEHLIDKYGSFENISQVEEVTFNRDGEIYYAQVSPLEVNDLDWMVVVVVPARDFMGPVYDNIRTTAYFGIIGLILSGALGFIFAGWIIRPVFTVTDVAASKEDEKWELGPLEKVAERTDELGQLARVSSKMAEELHARELELRRQVRALSIQIDQAKLEKEVKEIVENDFFIELQNKAAKMRERAHRRERNEEVDNEEES